MKKSIIPYRLRFHEHTKLRRKADFIKTGSGQKMFFLCCSLFFLFIDANVTAQEPYYFHGWINAASIEGSVFWPNEYYLPYDRESRNNQRDDITSHYGLRLAGLYNSARILPNLVAFGTVHFFFGKEQNDLHPIVLNLEYGVGYRLSSFLLCRITKSSHSDIGGFPESGELLWVGVSLVLKPAESISIGPLTLDGTSEFFFFPPHNEYDPNPGVPFEDRVVARYALDVNCRLIYRQLLPKMTLCARAFLPLGNSHPQIDYNYKADPISVIWQTALEYELNEALSVRILYSSQQDLGGLVNGHRRLDWSAISLQWIF